MPLYSIRRLLWAGPFTTLVAILVDVLYYDFTKSFGEQYLLPMDAGSTKLIPMPVLMPVLAILVSGMTGTIFFGLLLHFSKKPATIFLSVAITALILSFGGPFGLPETGLQTKILLGGMEFIAGFIIAGGIIWMSHPKVKIP